MFKITAVSGLFFVAAALLCSCVIAQPFVLEPDKSPEELFGYALEYTQNVPAFDSKNRPYIRSRTEDKDKTSFVHTLRDGKWVKKDFLGALKETWPDFAGTVSAAGWVGARVVFDANDTAYTLLTIRLADKSTKNVLLFSRDYCDTFKLHELPDGSFAHEHDVGHNDIQGPPFIAIMRHFADHPARWTSRNSLYVLQPKFEGDNLATPAPVLVTTDCFGMSQHSGGASFAVTKGNKTHFVWAEVTDEDVPGCPTFVATYDHDIGTVGEKKLLAYAPPINDVHNTPGICIDSAGYLHAVTGSHGQPFKYCKSLEPNDAYSGWTEPVEVLETGWKTEDTDEDGAGRQTYLSLLCDEDDTLHIAFRQWRRDVDKHHPGGYYAALSYQRKRKGLPWEKQARPLLVAALPGYSIYYHKMALDRSNRLFLSFSYLSDQEIKKKTRPGMYHDRMVIMSADSGDNWKPATTEDFVAGILK